MKPKVGDILNMDELGDLLKLNSRDCMIFIVKNVINEKLGPVFKPNTMSEEDDLPTGWLNNVSLVPKKFARKDGIIANSSDNKNILVAFRILSSDITGMVKNGI